MYNLGTKENLELEKLIRYFEDKDKQYEKDMDSLYNSRTFGGFNQTNYITKNKMMSKQREKNKIALNLLRGIGSFRSAGFYVDPELLGILNDIFPLLDESDKNRISAVIYNSIIEHKKAESIFVAELHSSKKMVMSLLDHNQQIAFNSVLEGFQRFYENRDYQAKIFVNTTDTPDEWYMSEPIARNYSMINSLMEENKLTDPYIIENYDLIRDSYLAGSKAIFINDKISEILLMKDSKCDINLGKLQKALIVIKNKNKKLIQNTNKITLGVNEQRLQEEYENHIGVAKK